MLKTDIERPARPMTPLIVLAVLSGYVQHPVVLLLGTLLAMRRFRKGLPARFHADFVRTIAMPALLYRRLRDKLGRDVAFEVFRAIMTTTGFAIQYGNFRGVEAPRTFANLVRFQQRTNREGPTRWNRMEVVEETEQRYEFKVHNCTFRDFFEAIGTPELTPIICAVDNAIFNTYLADQVRFHRGGPRETLATGAPVCRFILEASPAQG